MDSIFYKLDENKKVVPASVEEFEEVVMQQKKVKQENVTGKKGKNRYVSTVFLGLDYSLGQRRKEFFETMIFEREGGKVVNNYQERYSTYEEALEGHQKAVEYAKKH